jgi:hypothetical protein
MALAKPLITVPKDWQYVDEIRFGDVFRRILCHT